VLVLRVIKRARSRLFGFFSLIENSLNVCVLDSNPNLQSHPPTPTSKPKPPQPPQAPQKPQPQPQIHPHTHTQVVLAPDPDLIPHLISHGVSIDPGQSESERVGRSLLVQVSARALRARCGGGWGCCFAPWSEYSPALRLTP